MFIIMKFWFLWLWMMRDSGTRSVNHGVIERLRIIGGVIDCGLAHLA